MGQAGPVNHSALTPFGEILSDRKMEVLLLITQGATNHEIAEQLVITKGTVKSHINHILGKLDAHNRTEAVSSEAFLLMSSSEHFGLYQSVFVENILAR